MPNDVKQIDREVLEALWKHAEVGCCLVSEDGRFVKVNDKLCEILEYTPVELRNLTFQQVTHPKDVLADTEMAESLARGEVSHYRMVKTYLKKSGYPVQIELVVWPIMTAEGKFDFFLSQIVPRVNVHGLKDAGRADIHVSSSVVITEFLKDNKKLLAAATALMTAVAAVLGAIAQKVLSAV